jgi:hypothetical protein
VGESTRFLVDGMLGRLAKWLRAAGHDVDLADRARREDRVLLTRDHALARRRGVRSLLVESETLDDQLRQVLGLFPPAASARCLRCNVALEPVPLAAVQDFVPPYVRAHQSVYWLCPCCRRVYWQGTHWQHMQEQLRRLAP